MSAIDALYPRGEWIQLELCRDSPGPGPVSQADAHLVGAPLPAAPAAASGHVQMQPQGAQVQYQAGRSHRQSQNKEGWQGEAREALRQPGRGQQPQTLQAQWLAAWWTATAEAARHRQSEMRKDAAAAGRRAATAPVPEGEAEAVRDLELVQLLQYMHATQPELRAHTAAAGADGGWLGGSWRSGRALRRVARAPRLAGSEEAGGEQGCSSTRGGLAVVAAAAAGGSTPQPPSWWRAAVGDAVEDRLARSASGGAGGGSPAQPQDRGGTQPVADAPAAMAAALEARVTLLRAYAGTGLWSRRRGAPSAQGRKPRVNPASAVMQLVHATWAAQQGQAAQMRPPPLSTSGLAALLRSQQLLGAPLTPAAVETAVQMLEAQGTDSQPLPLAALSDILAGVSTCPRPLPPSTAAVLAAATQRSLHAAPLVAAGPEQLRRDGPVLLELVKSLARLWTRRQEQLHRAEQREPPGHATAVNAFEAALDACIPHLHRWLDSCSAAELLVASRSLITALRMRPWAGSRGSAGDAGNADSRHEDEHGQGGDVDDDDDDDDRTASAAAGIGAGASPGQVGARQRRTAGPPAPPAPALSAAWAAFEAASAPLLEGVLPGGVLLQLAVDVSFMQHKSDVPPRYKMQLLRALTAAMEQSARRLAGMRGPAPGRSGRGATAAERRGDSDPSPQHAATQTPEAPSDSSRNSSGGVRSLHTDAYTRPQPPRTAARPNVDSPRASGTGSSAARGSGGAAAAPAGSAAAPQLLSPDQVAHAAAATARLLSQDRFVPAAVARRMQAAVLVAAQAMQPRELCLALAALGELQLTGLTPTGSELLLKVLSARLPDLPPASLPLLLWSLARMRLRPPSQWLAEYSRIVQQHVLSYDMRQVAQLVWSYGQLVPQAPYSKMYFRPPRSLVQTLLRRCLASFGALESRTFRLRSRTRRVALQSAPRTPPEQPQRPPRPPAPRPTSAHYAQLRPADCALVVAGLAGLEARPDSRWLQGLYRWSGPLLASFRAPDLGMLLYGLARLEAAPPPAWVRRAARCAELQLFHATGLDTAYTAYGLARLRPALVSGRLLTALEVFVPLQLQNGAQEALRVGGVQAQQEVEAAWADFLRTAHRELRDAAVCTLPERGSGLQRAGVKARRRLQGADEQQVRVGHGGVRLSRLDTGKSYGLVWPWRRL
ncbi:hypothetical protein HYH02_009805 [Chlamydomonas schloesseri]|uniref:Uncharacterized protein n=1 Tax=Chlamydomonas schloesseri TaxID=2026947 RepID=A0A835TBA9_9CHLO|nr:hypothetical protein HYH02_009805 [Chlamydomonas schloesseri]|eukprot:KAG2442013.1 hypothetical protein HYH02_009805 [Chlamydomonas schloesseri]